MATTFEEFVTAAFASTAAALSLGPLLWETDVKRRNGRARVCLRYRAAPDVEHGIRHDRGIIESNLIHKRERIRAGVEMCTGGKVTLKQRGNLWHLSVGT